MTQVEMSEIFAVMLLAWPNSKVFEGGIEKLKPTIKLWARELPEVDAWTGQQAVKMLCRTNKFPPTIAEFREASEGITQMASQEADAAWDKLRTLRVLRGKDGMYQALSTTDPCRLAIDAAGGPDGLTWRSFRESYMAITRQRKDAGRRLNAAVARKEIGGG